MDLGIKGRVAVVTAASRGLGKATAMELAAEGANLVINSRGEEELAQVASGLRSDWGVDVLPVAGDVTNDEDVRRIISEAHATFGRVDILVTNAGGPPAGLFGDFTAGHYRDSVELNLISAINLCREAVPHMRKQAWGRIVAITSVAAKQPLEN